MSKSDAINWALGKPSFKLVSKETLNHPELINLTSGLDVYKNTPQAYLRAYQALGIDIINRVPTTNAPPPTPVGQVRPHPNKRYSYSHLGVYDTLNCDTFGIVDVDDVWRLDVESLEYDFELNPMPHSCEPEDIRLREASLGEVGLYYPMLYTTLFMWGVQILGWEIFMLAASLEPDRFYEHFLVPCSRKSKRIVEKIASSSDSPLVFVHDDIASGSGPVFAPGWYKDYIFSLYPNILAPAKARGKKVILVVDGNISVFLPGLLELGFDGVQVENPATPLDSVIERFGSRLIIGGIDTRKLTTGSPAEIHKMVLDVAQLAHDHSGLAISSCGGLHGNIPLANLEAYFDARAEVGATPRDWRTCRGAP
jgi:hypothetical protein